MCFEVHYHSFIRLWNGAIINVPALSKLAAPVAMVPCIGERVVVRENGFLTTVVFRCGTVLLLAGAAGVVARCRGPWSCWRVYPLPPLVASSFQATVAVDPRSYVVCQRARVRCTHTTPQWLPPPSAAITAWILFGTNQQNYKYVITLHGPGRSDWFVLVFVLVKTKSK